MILSLSVSFIFYNLYFFFLFSVLVWRGIRSANVGDEFTGTEFGESFLVLWPYFLQKGIIITSHFQIFAISLFQFQTIVALGEQMIRRLKWLHDRGFVHRDLKPENFLIGIGEEEETLFLIDFGLSRRYRWLFLAILQFCITPVFRYRDGDKLVHIPHRKGKNLVGTAKYASLNSHLGIELSRRDDIESFGYIMVELCCGELPWKVGGWKIGKTNKNLTPESTVETFKSGLR